MKNLAEGTERCVCCGEIIPEGRQVCIPCLGEWNVTKKEQPEMCRFSRSSPCSYPFNDCKDCPANPKINDPYWGKGVIG